jgi:hypothetical protein
VRGVRQGVVMWHRRCSHIICNPPIWESYEGDLGLGFGIGMIGDLATRIVLVVIAK